MAQTTPIIQEFPMPDKAIDIARIEICGRYPADGKARNTACTAVGYILSGSGRLNAGTNDQKLSPGAVFQIPKGQAYCFEGEFVMLMSCAPAWSPQQAETVAG